MLQTIWPLTLQSSSATLLSVNFLRNEVDFNHAAPPELVDFDVEADVSSAQWEEP